MPEMTGTNCWDFERAEQPSYREGNVADEITLPCFHALINDLGSTHNHNKLLFEQLSQAPKKYNQSVGRMAHYPTREHVARATTKAPILLQCIAQQFSSN